MNSFSQENLYGCNESKFLAAELTFVEGINSVDSISLYCVEIIRAYVIKNGFEEEEEHVSGVSDKKSTFKLRKDYTINAEENSSYTNNNQLLIAKYQDYIFNVILDEKGFIQQLNPYMHYEFVGYESKGNSL